MAEAPRKVTPQWAFMQGFQVTKNGRPYLDRLRVIQTPLFSVLLHRIHQPDADRDPHDHPWPFASLILSGSYTESIWDDPGRGRRGILPDHVRERRRWSLRTVGLDQAHMITRTEGVLWTLVFTGRRHPLWRFWTLDGPVDWRDYLAAGESTDDNPW
jgi:hypothetical protein